MQKYKSHKIVEAVKIGSIGNGYSNDTKYTIMPDESEHMNSFIVSGDYVRKHEPHAGGYYVLYADGYASFSPAEAFESGYTAVDEKTLHNSDISGTRENVKDIKVVGNGDAFSLICKASSEAEGWMKSTKAYEIPNIGCIVQVTTQQRNIDLTYSIAEALTFVPGVRIKLDENNGRKLVAM